MTDTRTQIINAARQLFAERGKENVTMIDVATISGKGRRTLYLHFKNKEELYRTLVDYELNVMYNSVLAVSDKILPPKLKLSEFIWVHLDTVQMIINRNGTLRSDFFRNISEIERLRRKTDRKEMKLIRRILEMGISRGEFKKMNVELTTIILFQAMKGMEIPYIRRNKNPDFEKSKRYIVNFVLRGILV